MFYQVEDRDFFLKRRGEGGGLIPIRVELLNVLLGTVLPLGYEKKQPHSYTLYSISFHIFEVQCTKTNKHTHIMRLIMLNYNISIKNWTWQ